MGRGIYEQDSIQWQHGKVFEISDNKRRRIGNIKQALTDM